jgi:hypothetical protein
LPRQDQITVAIRGFRYLVYLPVRRVIVQEVERTVYGEPTEEAILAIAVKHDAAIESQVESVLCDAAAELAAAHQRGLRCLLGRASRARSPSA